MSTESISPELLKKIRRRIEARLRRDKEGRVILEVARLLKVKMT